MVRNEPEPSGTICFGLDQETDRRSFEAFIRRLAAPALLPRLSSRLDSDEIALVVNQITGLLKRHLSHDEYHRHFLGEE